MNTQVVEGTPKQVADHILRLGNAVVRAVIYTEEPAPTHVPPSDEDMFAEMEPYTVAVGHVDDSREAIYTRMEGE